MVTIVVVLNVLISLVCLYVAWQVWNLRRTLVAVVNAIAIAERNTYAVLHGAPDAIDKGQLGVHTLRERYQQLELQLQQVQQVLTVLGLLQSLLRPRLRLRSNLALNRSASRSPATPVEEQLSKGRYDEERPSEGYRTKTRSRSKRLRRSPRYRN